ncbi:MAG: tetratricopeptide repeat protein, partial [Nitrosotalea sp.]
IIYMTMSEHELNEEEFSFKSYFIPLTTLKAINWIVIIGLIVFANMLFNGFVWDDKTYIILNQQVHSFDLARLIGNSLFNSGGNYRPIPALYFTTLYSLFRDYAFFYHFIQLIFHTINTVLLYLVFKKFFKNATAFFLSLIFLIHPIQVESVSYIASTTSTIFFQFGILAVLFLMQKKESIQKIIIIFTLLLLSLFTKETGFLFLIVVLLYKILFNRENVKKYLLASVCIFVIYLIFRFFIGDVYVTKLTLIPIDRLTLIQRISNIPAIILYYLKTLLFPYNFVIDQQWVVTTIDFSTFYFPLLIDLSFLLLLAVIGTYLFKRKKSSYKIFLFFVFWFCVGMFLHLQILPLDLTVADRWFYFPFVGLLGIIGTITHMVKINNKYLVRIGYSLLIIVLVFLSIRTIMRNQNWKDAITLYTHDIKIYDNFDIENNLSLEYANISQYQNALIHAHKSVTLFPNEINIDNIGYIYLKEGSFEKAQYYYSKAYYYKHYLPILQKHTVNTYLGLGASLMYLNNLESANKFLEEGTKEYSDDDRLWEMLAISEYKSHNTDIAIGAIRKAMIISPGAQTDYIYHS